MDWVKELVLDQLGRAVENPTTYSGGFLVSFALVHGVGNLNAFKGRTAYNAYGYRLMSVPGFMLVEAGLAATFLVHMVGGLKSFGNVLSFAMKSKDGLFSESSREMLARPLRSVVSGLAIIYFVNQHLQHIRFAKGDYPKEELPPQHRWPHLKDSKEIPLVPTKDIYQLAIEAVKSTKGTVQYAFAIFMLWVHIKAAIRPALSLRVGIPIQYSQQFLNSIRATIALAVATFSASLLKLKM